MLKIIADENLAYPAELFSQLGKVTLVNGRKIINSSLKDADVLIVRSVTEVNSLLLKDTNVKFVGTATIGTDHIDTEYLKSRKIAFASAPGCNSYAVAEYVLSAILYMAVKDKFQLKDKTIGVVGIGNVGSKVTRFCEALGMKVLKNDPPLYRAGRLADSVPLNELLKADIITLHVPLTFEGEDKTYHLLNSDKLNQLNQNSVLINTSRGSVIDEKALIHTIDKKSLRVILDVWENEPAISKVLMSKVTLGTPHIAGYSLEGKVNGTILVYEALAEYLKKEKNINIRLPLAPDNHFFYNHFSDLETNLNSIVQKIYNIENDHFNLYEIISLDENRIINHFDRLRKDYPLRREFNNYKIGLSEYDSKLSKLLTALRFNTFSQ